MSTLRTALDAANAAREAYFARCLIVWRELQTVEPELADEILALGFDESAAAQWICHPNRGGDTPAACVAAGRSADVRASIQRAMHGFVG